jgi:hypothetical protein
LQTDLSNSWGWGDGVRKEGSMRGEKEEEEIRRKNKTAST